MPEQPTSAAVPSSSGPWPAVEQVIKVSAAVLALVAALGAPAIAVQMGRLSIPAPAAGTIFDLLTSGPERAMAVRAGLLPGLALALLAYLVHRNLVYNIAWERQKAGTASNELSLVGLALQIVALCEGVLLFLLVLELLIGAALRRPLAGFVVLAALLVVAGVLSAAGIVSSARFTSWLGRSFLRAGAMGTSLGEKGSTARLLMVSGIAAAAGFLIAWSGLAIGAKVSGIGGEWRVILAVALAAVMGGAISFLAEVTRNLSRPASIAWYRQPLWTASVVYFYLPLVFAWSLKWYPQLPYAMGGGKPVPCMLWVDGKKFPKGLGRMLPRASLAPEQDSIRVTNAFLVYRDSDIAILADGDNPFAHGVLFTKDAIQAIAPAP